MVELSCREALAACEGDAARSLATRLVADSAGLLGTDRLLAVDSAHIDGALYHGDSGTLFAERLVELRARVAVRATLNVGALDLTGCSGNRLAPHERDMARRMMKAYIAMGCEPSWTCAPYQAGHRPAAGSQVAWGESNAVVFCNSVLAARTNRYGDFLDIACAIAGLAPATGLHLTNNRVPVLRVDLSQIPREALEEEVFWPVFGSLYGRIAGSRVGLITGLGRDPGEDALKAFGAAAASTGGVGLFHMEGITPEAAGLDPMLKAHLPAIDVTREDLREQKRLMATALAGDQLDAVAIGSPHLSLAECELLVALLRGRKLSIPFYACTGRHVLARLEASGLRRDLAACGVTLVIDSCVVVAPVMKEIAGGVLMTNSGKFAQYAPGNTGYGVLFGSLAECVESAVAGRPVHG